MLGLRGCGVPGKGGAKGHGGRFEGKGGQGEREVNLSGRRLDDAQFEGWCERWKGGVPLISLSSLNLSSNELGNRGGSLLVELLTQLGAPIRTLKLFSNHLGDDAAVSLARYIEGSRHTLAELHLSHNIITQEGAAALLTAAAAAPDKTGGPRYPSFERACTMQRPVPLWLRLEHNLIETLGNSFQSSMEEALVRARRTRGYLDNTDGRPPPMICEAVAGVGCSSRACALLCPGSLGGAPGGPVVHAPHLRKQRRPSDLPRSGLLARSSSRPLVAPPAPGSEAPVGILKPPAGLPRARSPGRSHAGDEEEAGRAKGATALPVKQCRFADVLLVADGPGMPTPCSTPPVPEIAWAPTKAGDVRRVTRRVTTADAITAGYSPETYLQPLEPEERVAVLHVDGDWIWAKRAAGGKEGGWLALDATARL